MKRADPANARWTAARRKSDERGASVFIVVLVIAMLTAIGVFAARSSRLSTTASGHARQMTQTHYLTEYGMELSAAVLSTNIGAHVNRMHQVPDTKCFGMAGALGASCLKMYVPNLQKQLLPQGVLVELPTSAAAGSLGSGSLDASFSIEMTSYAQGAAVAGYDLSPTSTAHFKFATLVMTGIGQIRPTGTTSWTSSESARAFLTLGPL